MKIILILSLFFLSLPFALSQTTLDNEEDYEETGDTIEYEFEDCMTDSIFPEDTELPWGARIREHLGILAAEADEAYYTTGICVYDLTGDSLLFEYNRHKVMRPASTQKLLTAIAALSILGADHQYRTRAYYTGNVSSDSTLHGDIYIVGDFDPAFSYSDMLELASSIENLGVRRIEGKVYGDISMKDSLYFGNGWCWDDAPSEVEAYLSPLTFNRGCATVEIVEGKPDFSIPTSYLKLEDRTGRSGRFSVTRNWIHGGNTFVVSGKPSRYSRKTLSVYRPELYFLCTLTDILHERGVEIIHCEGDSSEYALRTLPSSSTPFYTCYRTIEQILQRMMKKSDNLYAESMFYQLASVNSGRWASWKDGARQVESVIHKAGESSAYTEVADGSGVSLYNYVSPQTEVALLRYAFRTPSIYNALFPSLPVAGMDGTLSERMTRGTAYGKVHAKTGTVSGVSCLAGYCTASNGNVLAFSIMNNGLMKTATGRRFQDRVCQELTK
ncbi:MAG: D-alanyl-D-alanine carboxypeptidase/D-alanyl-D-alanine-endopeptidase [Prevotellaceae bacterium]|nr:D-alanyl-D-alanine carboxypeptidase/D-alanyl-D-alanine-endopeptidase [Prevotellaceae bacterium]